MRAFSASSTIVNATAVKARLGYSASDCVASSSEICGQRRGRADQRGDEDHHQQRGLGEEADHHFASGAERTESCADVHRGERYEDARRREQADERDGVSGPRERQARGDRGNDRCGRHHRAEDDVRGEPKQGRGVGRDHRILVEELADAAIGQHERRGRFVLQPRAALIHPSEKQRRGQQGSEDAEYLRDPVERRS